MFFLSKLTLIPDKLDERRSKNWMNNDILADADITVDKSAINVRK